MSRLLSLARAALVASALALGACGDGNDVQTHEGSLASGDQTLKTGEYTDVYNVTAKAGQWILVEMTSTAFDPYIILVSPSENQTENDDSNGSLQLAVVRQQVTEDGRWRISATSANTGETGAYTLKISVSDTEPVLAGTTATPGAAPERAGTSGAAEPAGATPGGVLAGAGSAPDTTAAFVVRPGKAPTAPTETAAEGGAARTVQGVLEDGDDRLQSGEFTDILTLDARPGQTITVEMTSDALDPYLILRGPGGEQVDDDDTGEGTNARLQHVVGEGGTWRVSFTTATVGESGAYRASVRVQ